MRHVSYSSASFIDLIVLPATRRLAFRNRHYPPSPLAAYCCAPPKLYITVKVALRATNFEIARAAVPPSRTAPAALERVSSAAMGVRGEVTHGMDARKKLGTAPLTRSLRAATMPNPPPKAEEETVLVVVPRTYPFPPPHAPLSVPLAAKNTPRKSLLKRWRGSVAKEKWTKGPDSMSTMRKIEKELVENEVREIVDVASRRMSSGDGDLRRLRRAVMDVKESAKEDMVRLATRHSNVQVRVGDKVTLALHEMDAQTRAEVEVVVDRERGVQKIEASEELKLVRDRISELEACGVKVIGVEKMSPI